MCPVRALSLVTLGGFAGFAASAAVLRRALPSRGDAESDEVALVAIYNGIDLKSRAEAFRGGSMLAWFGGIAVDLREATLAPGAHLSVNSLFGEVAIRVPPGWRVESKEPYALAGGVDVRRRTWRTRPRPRCTLDGLALFGGIAVGAGVAEAAFSDAPESVESG